MIDKEARLKNLEWMSDELLKIAHNKDLSLDAELRYVRNLKQAYINKKAAMDDLSYPLAMDMSKEQLMALPTLSESQMDDLKFDDGRHRIWVSRMTVEDGAPEDNQVSFETLQNGRWIQSSLSTPVTTATKLSVFNKEFIATPINDQKKFGGYDISQNGKKILNIKSKDSQPMTKDQLEFCAKIELTRGLKEATLKDKIAFLEAGTKVYVLATDKTGKRTKFASLEHGLRGWVSSSKLQLKALESQSVTHESHSDKILGQTATETLLDCIEGGPKWVSSTELLDSNRPPATPESLNDMDLESAKECPDCHGTFEGAEGATCPTCGRFAVQQKEALKPALPPQILNRRMEVNADYQGYSNYDTWGLALWLDNDQDLYNQVHTLAENANDTNELASMLKHEYSNLLEEKGETNKSSANVNWNELAQNYIDEVKENQEYDRSQSAGGTIDKLPTMDIEKAQDEVLNQLAKETDPEKKKSLEQKYRRLTMASLKVQAHIRHENGKWIVYNHDFKKKLGTYDTKSEALKRLRQIEFYKNASLKPFSKKAEVLSNPYQSLTDHITDMKSRMTQVQDKMQSVPAVKTAGEDNSEMDLPALFADLTQGIELLETKLGGDSTDPEVHKGIEELENRIWKLEEFVGLTPKLSEHEKAEPEHKEIVDDIEDKKKVNKSAVDVTVTDETLEEGEGIPPTATTPATVAPTIQNVQPTDNDNLEVPITAPTSPPPPGQHWVYNSDPTVNAYVLMPDPTDLSKTV